MNAGLHLRLHALRAAELRHEAAPKRLPRTRTGIRHQLGWTLVELGLRLVNRTVLPTARIA